MSHERRGESDEWYTPKYIFDALGLVFDIDVACPPEGPRYTPARSYFSENAIQKEWGGLVWMNPPFSNQATKRLWLHKFFDHGNGIALLPDRTSAGWWQIYAEIADVVLFIAPKVKFERPDGSIGKSPGNGTTLFAAGMVASDALIQSGLGLVFRPEREKGGE
jgi:hypothetical protein